MCVVLLVFLYIRNIPVLTVSFFLIYWGISVYSMLFRMGFFVGRVWCVFVCVDVVVGED